MTSALIQTVGSHVIQGISWWDPGRESVWLLHSGLVSLHDVEVRNDSDVYTVHRSLTGFNHKII